MSLSLMAWRRARNISQQKMANLLEVHVNTYQKWEEKPENISINNAFKICKILDVPLDEIKFITEE